MLGSRNPRILSLLSILWAALVVAQEADTKPKPAVESEADKATETAAEPATDVRTADLQKIEAAIESYVTAFNGKDVDKLVSLWAPDGVYVSQSSGDQLTGHDELKKDFQSIFANEDAPKLAVETESIEFISPNVALERGMATVTGKDFVDQTAYRVVYVERDGRWLIDRVTEESVVVKPSNYEHLQGLDFIVGQWVAEIDGTTIEIDCQWTTNQNYLSRKYRVLTDGNVESSGLQIIGWDAKNEQIRSWLFDSEGGFVKGTWTQRDNEWIVQSVATLADGASGSSTSIYSQLDADTVAWRKTNRVVDGKLLPNTEEVTVYRQ